MAKQGFQKKMQNILKRNPIAAIEIELANLAARRETLEKRETDATARLEAARNTRKTALSADPGAELTGLTRAVRDGEDEVETLKGVLADLADQVADAEQRLAEAKDADVRAASAKTLEQIAGTFDSHAAELDSAIAALGKAAAKMVATLPETLKIVELSFDSSKSTERERLVALIIAEGIASAFPAAFPMQAWGEKGGIASLGHNAVLKRHFGLISEHIRSYTHDIDEAPITARQAAVAVVTERLRKRAEHIVAGDMSPNLEDAPIFRPAPEPVRIPLVEVFALENFAFRLKTGDLPTLVGRRWAHRIPEDAADEAVAHGVALRTDTPEGAQAFQDEKSKRAATQYSSGAGRLDLSMCRDLGVIRQSVENNVVALHDGAEAAA